MFMESLRACLFAYGTLRGWKDTLFLIYSLTNDRLPTSAQNPVCKKAVIK